MGTIFFNFFFFSQRLLTTNTVAPICAPTTLSSTVDLISRRKSFTGLSKTVNIAMASQSSTPQEVETSHLSDPGWGHCTAVTADKRKVRCNYCGKEMSGGVNRFKYHLAKVPGDVKTCSKVSDKIAATMKEFLSEKEKLTTKRKWETWISRSNLRPSALKFLGRAEGA